MIALGIVVWFGSLFWCEALDREKNGAFGSDV